MFWVLGNSVSGHARTVANVIVGVRGVVAAGVGVLVILMQLVWSKCTRSGQGKGGGFSGLRGWGWDEWC